MKNKYILITLALVLVSFIGGYFLGISAGFEQASLTIGPSGAPTKVAFLPYNIQPTEDQKKALEKIEAKYNKSVIQARLNLSKVLTPEQIQKRAEAGRKAIEEGKKGKDLIDYVDKAAGITADQQEKIQTAQKELGQVMSSMNSEIAQLLTESQKKEIEQKRQEIIKQNASRVESASKAAPVKEHSNPKESSSKKQR